MVNMRDFWIKEIRKNKTQDSHQKTEQQKAAGNSGGKIC